MNNIIKWLVILALCGGCLHNADEAPRNYAIDGLYCWHKNSEGVWQEDGLPDRCPPNTETMDRKNINVVPMIGENK